MGIMYNPTLNFRKHFFSKGEFFFQTGTLFHKVNFFSRAARYSPAHEPWELVPLDELSLPGILQRWNQRFQVSNPSPRYVIARRDSVVAILSAKKGLLHPCGVRNDEKSPAGLWETGKTLKNCQREFGQMEKRQTQWRSNLCSHPVIASKARFSSLSIDLRLLSAQNCLNFLDEDLMMRKILFVLAGLLCLSACSDKEAEKEIVRKQNELQQIQTQIDKVNAEMDSLKAVDEMLKKELDSLDMNP